eukprot:s3511_g5.t1
MVGAEAVAEAERLRTRKQQIIQEVRRILHLAHLQGWDLVRSVYQLPQGYSDDELRRARKKLLLVLHPDQAGQLIKAEVDGQVIVDQVHQAYLVQDRARIFVEAANAPPPPPPEPEQAASSSRPAAAPPPTAAGRWDNWMKRCAHGRCSFLCTNPPKFGGFCCRACYESWEAREDPEHGGCCKKKPAARWTPWAEPVPPEAPTKPLQKTRIWEC